MHLVSARFDVKPTVPYSYSCLVQTELITKAEKGVLQVHVLSGTSISDKSKVLSSVYYLSLFVIIFIPISKIESKVIIL